MWEGGGGEVKVRGPFGRGTDQIEDLENSISVVFALLIRVRAFSGWQTEGDEVDNIAGWEELVYISLNTTVLRHHFEHSVCWNI